MMFKESQRIFECCSLFNDLRSTNAEDVTGNGRKLLQSQNGIVLEITKKATTKNVKCYIFTQYDALVNIIGGDFQNVMY